METAARAAEINGMSRRSRTALALALCLLAAVVAVSPAASSPTRAGARMSSLEAGILVELNGIRTQHGLRPLRASVPLAKAAAAHSVEMGDDGYFEHDSFDGTPFWKRISRFYPLGNGNWSVGENLLWSSGALGPGAAVADWMASPPHRANILSRQWHEIGVAAARFDSAGGVYGGRSVIILTTDFGVRG
jgi:uncharacterized protein YkwD